MREKGEIIVLKEKQGSPYYKHVQTLLQKMYKPTHTLYSYTRDPQILKIAVQIRKVSDIYALLEKELTPVQTNLSA